MSRIFFTVLLFFLIVNCNFLIAASEKTNKPSRNVTLVVNNQRYSTLSVEQIFGDKRILIDSLKIKTKEDQELNHSSSTRTYTFTLSSNLPAGIYHLEIGQTLVAELLNEPPQSIDIIVNSEDIYIETDFEKPLEKINVIKSEENKLWHQFARKERTFNKAFQLAGKEVDYCLGSKEEIKACVKQINDYNKLQKQQNQFIDSITEPHPDLLASRIIKSYKIPDAHKYIDKSQRDSILKSQFFKYIDFSDESLLNSSVLTDKIYSYLMLFAKPGFSKKEQEKQFMLAIKNVLDLLRIPNSTEPKNSNVYDFVIDYLLRGFEETNMPEIVNFIGENYSTFGCESESKSIVDRKLAHYKMKTGDIVPDFILNDINGDPIQLTEFSKPVNIIIFWSSECGHCKKFLPKLRNWEKDIHAGDLEIFAISLDTDSSGWKKMVLELDMESWINLSDLMSWNGPTALKYNIFKTPTIFIVDENMKILLKTESIDEISQFYSKYIN